MSMELFAGFAILIAVAGVMWRSRTVQLGKRLFGPTCQIRYVHQRWVIEAMLNGRRVRYTTGGMNWFPALTYLLVESPVSTEFAATQSEITGAIPASIRETIVSLRRTNGFRRIDAMHAGSSPISTAGRVSWLHPGDGIMLRRYTSKGGDESMIRKDIELLQGIADALKRSTSQ